MSQGTGAGGKMILTLHDQYDRIVGERYVSSPQVSLETLRYATAEKDNSAARFDGNISETAFTHPVNGPGGTLYLQTDI